MSFAEFASDQQGIQLLQRSLDQGRLSHAYLFTGSHSAELQRVARTLAKTLNCQAPPKKGAHDLPMDSCNHCRTCQRIEEENHPDVYWVRPETKSRVITIDQMRELMRVIFLKPAEAKHKIAIIDGADRLNVQAGNAFLKTLEEPPSNSVVILLTTEPQRMLETILSRCMRLNFAGEGQERLEKEHGAWLSQFTKLAAQQQSGLLPRYCLLSQLLKRLSQIKEETDQQLTSRSPLEKYEELEPKLREKWEDQLNAAIEGEYRRRRSELILAVQWWLRDVWLFTLRLGQGLIAFPSLTPASEEVARRLRPEDALANLQTLEQAQGLLATNVQEALALEVSFLKLKL